MGGVGRTDLRLAGWAGGKGEVAGRECLPRELI